MMVSSSLNTEWRFRKLDKYPKRLICDDGVVYSEKGKPLSLKPSRKGGYLRVRMYHLGKETYTWVHRMVGYAFLGDCDGFDIHHKDKNIKNNHYLNLKKLTEKEHINEHRK